MDCCRRLLYAAVLVGVFMIMVGQTAHAQTCYGLPPCLNCADLACGTDCSWCSAWLPSSGGMCGVGLECRADWNLFPCDACASHCMGYGAECSDGGVRSWCSGEIDDACTSDIPQLACSSCGSTCASAGTRCRQENGNVFQCSAPPSSCSTPPLPNMECNRCAPNCSPQGTPCTINGVVSQCGVPPATCSVGPCECQGPTACQSQCNAQCEGTPSNWWGYCYTPCYDSCTQAGLACGPGMCPMQPACCDYAYYY